MRRSLTGGNLGTGFRMTQNIKMRFLRLVPLAQNDRGECYKQANLHREWLCTQNEQESYLENTIFIG
jgi:hypothetical protein